MSGVELLVVVATVVGGVSTITNFVYSYWKNKKLTKQNKLIQLKLSELNQISSNEPINPELPNGNVDVAAPSPVENDADHREVKAFFNTKTKQIEYFYEAPCTAREPHADPPASIIPKLNIKA